MSEKWWRLRWDDAGRSLNHARALLDELTQAGDVDVIWITTQNDLALVVRVEPHAEAILYEGLTQRLPGARIVSESASNVAAYTSGLSHAYVATGPVPDEPVFPQGLLDLGVAPASAKLSWRDGVLSCSVFADDDVDINALQSRWPGCKAWPQWAKGVVGMVKKPKIPSSRMLMLPSSQDFTMLASRKTDVRSFSKSHSNGALLLGSDISDKPVRLSVPGARLLWVGAPQRVDNVFGRMAQRWPGKVVVFDADVRSVDKAWQDVSDAVLVDWRTPGRSGHVNPLMRLPKEDLDAYAERIAAWLKSLGITAQVLGARVWEGLLALLRLVSEGEGVVRPPTLLSMLKSGDTVDVLRAFSDLKGRLSEAERVALESVEWGREQQCLAPAREILKQVFDIAEMVLWFPEYLSAERLREARWVIFRVPRRRKGQRLYWRAMMPLLSALYGDDADTLLLTLNTSTIGGEVIGWGGETSVISWGASIEAAIGQVTVPDGLDFIVGAQANPGRFAASLGVSRATLAAQNVYQAEGRLDGDTGSIRLRIPKAQEQEVTKPSPWRVGGREGGAVPTPTTVMGTPGAASSAVAALLRQSLVPDERVMVIGKRDVWGTLRADFEGEFTYLPANELPMLNPVDRRRKVFAWIWWGKGLGIPSEMLQRAYREGVDTIQGLLRYAQRDASEDLADSSAVAVLQDVCSTGLFGVAESDPADWFESAPWLAVESVNPALTRMLVMASVEADARIVLYDAPGVGHKDLPALRRGHALVYPSVVWIDNLLVTHGSNGLVRGLPLAVQKEIRSLDSGESYLYQRMAGRGQRVSLEVE